VSTREGKGAGHSIHMLVRAADDGGSWLGVGVCLECQPDVEVRRTFSHDGTCPWCGAPATLEWRWSPESFRSPTPPDTIVP
jgi:hypothetical protein